MLPLAQGRDLAHGASWSTILEFYKRLMEKESARLTHQAQRKQNYSNRINLW